MNKKDYIALADLLGKHATVTQLRQGFRYVIKRGEFMDDFCEYLKKDNPKFNEIKFREASGDIHGTNS